MVSHVAHIGAGHRNTTIKAHVVFQRMYTRVWFIECHAITLPSKPSIASHTRRSLIIWVDFELVLILPELFWRIARTKCRWHWARQERETEYRRGDVVYNTWIVLGTRIWDTPCCWHSYIHVIMNIGHSQAWTKTTLMTTAKSSAGRNDWTCVCWVTRSRVGGGTPMFLWYNLEVNSTKQSEQILTKRFEFLLILKNQNHNAPFLISLRGI